MMTFSLFFIGKHDMYAFLQILVKMFDVYIKTLE